MIEVVYNKADYRVTVKGHAGSAEYGHDLVCASASMLMYTLAAAVEKLSTEKKARSTVIRLDDGNAEISCTPERRHKETATTVFETVCGGFALLARDFPKNILYEPRG